MRAASVRTIKKGNPMRLFLHFVCLAFITSAVTSTAWPQTEPALIPRQALFTNPDKEQVMLSPDEPHDFRRAENWVSLFAIAERFFHDHLGGRYEPIGDDLSVSSLEAPAGAELIPGLLL